MSFEPISILLVEDNPADIRLTQEALKENKMKVDLHIAMDGEIAMAFLKKQNDYAHVPTPDLIILDLNMPKKDGREVLKEVKEDPILRSIPIVVLTISQSEEDILLTYKYHVNCYIRKPLDLNKFIDVVKAIESFWFTIVTLPPKSQA